MLLDLAALTGMLPPERQPVGIDAESALPGQASASQVVAPAGIEAVYGVAEAVGVAVDVVSPALTDAGASEAQTPRPAFAPVGDFGGIPLVMVAAAAARLAAEEKAAKEAAAKPKPKRPARTAKPKKRTPAVAARDADVLELLQARREERAAFVAKARGLDTRTAWRLEWRNRRAA
jgi:hypothetical protein